MTEQGPPDPKRRRLDSVIPELFKRAVEIGVEKATEAPDSLKNFVGDMKLPKEIATTLLAQMEETKNGLFRVVAKEIREFLEHTNLAVEMRKMLTTVQFEINTTIRFSPNDGSLQTTQETKESKAEKAEKVDHKARDKGDKAAADEGAAAPAPTAPPTATVPVPEVKTQLHVVREGRPARERKRSRE